jgi:TetR/AcrR family transcriptional repressor of mexJK operon
MTPRHKRSVREEAMQETRTNLLKAAAQEFAQHGYAGANVNRIAAAAGFSVGTVYNHFPSKRELMLAFIDEIGGRHVDFILEQVMEETDLARRMQRFFRTGFEFIQTHLPESQAIFNTLNGPDEAFRQRLFETYAPLFDLLSQEILNPGIAHGDFRSDLPATTSGLIMLIYLGAGSQISSEGRHWIAAGEVADFVIHALHP